MPAPATIGCDGYKTVHSRRRRVYTYETRTPGSNYTQAQLHLKAPLQDLPLQKVTKDESDTTQTIRKIIGPERPNVSSSISSPRLQVLSMGATTVATQPTSLPEQHGAQVKATARNFLSLSGFLSAKNPTPEESDQWGALLKEAAGPHVFRHLNLDVCKHILDHISRANPQEIFKIFRDVGPEEYESISYVVEDMSAIPTRVRLTYDAVVHTMVVEMPNFVHEAPFDDLKDPLSVAMSNIPYDPDIIHARVRMNTTILVERSSLIPDMVVSLMNLQGTSNAGPQYVLVGECAFSQKKSHAIDKLWKCIRGLPNLQVVILVVVNEDPKYRSPVKNSSTWSFFQNAKHPLSQTDFLELCPDAGQPHHLGGPITVGGHTWCHISSVTYSVWVRQPGEGPIDLDSTDAVGVAHGTLFPHISMDAVDSMLQKGLSAIKHAIVNHLNLTLDSRTVSAITQSETPLSIRWTNVQSSFLAAMKVTAHQRYHWWLEQIVFRGQKRPYGTDSDSESDNQVPPPTPDDTQQSEMSQPEDVGDHLPAPSSSISPQASSSRRSGRLAHRLPGGQKIEIASQTTVKNHKGRVTKRRVMGN